MALGVAHIPLYLLLILLGKLIYLRESVCGCTLAGNSSQEHREPSQPTKSGHAHAHESTKSFDGE
jgi:hypothetical protein